MTANASGNNTGSAQGHQIWLIIAGIITAAAAVLAALVPFVGLPWHHAAAVAFMAAALLFGLSLVGKSPLWRRLVTATLILILVALAAGFAGYGEVWRLASEEEPREPKASVAPSPSPSSDLLVVDPPASPPEQRVPPCFFVRVKGSLHETEALAVGHQEVNTPLIYFEGSVQPGAGGSYEIHVSIEEAEEAGKRFKIFVVLGQKKLIDYLVSTNPKYPEATWWAATAIPPAARQVALIDVVQDPRLPAEC
jgi:hypothetical protein